MPVGYGSDHRMYRGFYLDARCDHCDHEWGFHDGNTKCGVNGCEKCPGFKISSRTKTGPRCERCGHHDGEHYGGLASGKSECAHRGRYEDCACSAFIDVDPKQMPPDDPTDPTALNLCTNCGHGWLKHAFTDDLTSFTACSIRFPTVSSVGWCGCAVFRSEYGGPDIPRHGDFPSPLPDPGGVTVQTV
jgi:uncharacterized protein (DUF983 family)